MYKAAFSMGVELKALLCIIHLGTCDVLPMVLLSQWECKDKTFDINNNYLGELFYYYYKLPLLPKKRGRCA